jgi:hypothetical protein
MTFFSPGLTSVTNLEGAWYQKKAELRANRIRTQCLVCPLSRCCKPNMGPKPLTVWGVALQISQRRHPAVSIRFLFEDSPFWLGSCLDGSVLATAGEYWM